jgi:hypothetical protein
MCYLHLDLGNLTVSIRKHPKQHLHQHHPERTRERVEVLTLFFLIVDYVVQQMGMYIRLHCMLH